MEKKYHTLGTIPKSNIKIVEKGKGDTPTHKYKTAYFPGITIKSGGVKLVVWV